jgi:preprotein translocase subunit SecA
MNRLPSTTWRMLSQDPPAAKIPQGLDEAWHRAARISGSLVRRQRRFLRRAEQIVSMEKQFSHLSDRRLKDVISRLAERFRLGRDAPEDVNRAFALVREAADRTIGLRPYPVQVAGALAIAEGWVAEMATGEGKTLVATLPAVLAGWRGRGCHLVTANEYLAKRDAGWMEPVYRFCKMTVGHIENGMTPAERKRAYDAHITYGTSQEMAADFLRDRLTLGRFQGLSSALLAKMAGLAGAPIDRLVQRGLECAIVDEADSVLIDEAVTPLIIAGEGPNPEQVEAYQQAATLAGKLSPESDFRVDRRRRDIHLTGSGTRRLDDLADPIGGLWASFRRREELVVQALTAREFFLRDKHYVVDHSGIVIVDEFTGRPMADRTWRHGLHQAIEAKEEVPIHLPKETFARISFQRFFRLYRKISGMTGTAAETRNELWQIYQLPVAAIPPRRPCRRKVLPDRTFPGTAEKWEAIVEEIRSVHRTGRPILIGTRSVGASEHLSSLLTAEHLAHEVLNATRLAQEAKIIAGAGQKSRITVATNMAGRGTDIRLGRGVGELGGLHVVATERHEARRIDRQLFGRCARQGDPGSARAFVSLEDELLQRQGSKVLQSLVRRVRSRMVFSALSGNLIRRAQRRAEHAAFRQRKEVLRTDHWLDEHLGFAGKGP